MPIVEYLKRIATNLLSQRKLHILDRILFKYLQNPHSFTLLWYNSITEKMIKWPTMFINKQNGSLFCLVCRIGFGESKTGKEII